MKYQMVLSLRTHCNILLSVDFRFFISIFQMPVTAPVSMTPFAIPVCTGPHHIPVCTTAHIPVCSSQATWSFPACSVPIPTCNMQHIPACSLPQIPIPHHTFPPLFAHHPHSLANHLPRQQHMSPPTTQFTANHNQPHHHHHPHPHQQHHQPFHQVSQGHLTYNFTINVMSLLKFHFYHLIHLNSILDVILKSRLSIPKRRDYIFFEMCIWKDYHMLNCTALVIFYMKNIGIKNLITYYLKFTTQLSKYETQSYSFENLTFMTKTSDSDSYHF